MGEPAPQRVLLKLSGNALSGEGPAPFRKEALQFLGEELAAVHGSGPQLAVVLGGGNVIRGATFCPEGRGRILADYAGMLATVVNALLLRDVLQARGVPATHYSAFAIPRMATAFEPDRCMADLQEGNVVLLAGGTGNPLLTTDTAAALRAVEIGADLLLKATRVDGVYSADPEEDAGAQLFDQVSYRQILEHRLGVMDLAAISLCMQHDLPVRVFNFAREANIRHAAAGENVGTLIRSSEDAD